MSHVQPKFNSAIRNIIAEESDSDIDIDLELLNLN